MAKPICACTATDLPFKFWCGCTAGQLHNGCRRRHSLSGGPFDYNGAIYVKAGAIERLTAAAHPFATIQSAFDAAVDGSVILAAAGTWKMSCCSTDHQLRTPKIWQEQHQGDRCQSARDNSASHSWRRLHCREHRQCCSDSAWIGSRGVVLIGGAGSSGPRPVGAEHVAGHDLETRATCLSALAPTSATAESIAARPRPASARRVVHRRRRSPTTNGDERLHARFRRRQCIEADPVPT